MFFPEMKKEDGFRLTPAETVCSGTDGSIPFPFTPLQVPPSSAGNLYGNPQNLSSTTVLDLNMKIDSGEVNKYNPTFDRNLIVRNDILFPEYEITSFPGTRVNVITNTECQTPDNLIAANHGVIGATHLENTFGSKINRNFINANSSTGVKFHLTRVDEEAKNDSRQLTKINASGGNFSGTATQLDCLDKLDGRFLSLGCQNNLGFDISEAYGGKVIHMNESSCSPHNQLSSNSLNRGGSLTGFQNNEVGFTTPWGYTGNLDLPHNDHGVFQGVTSGFGTSSVPVLLGKGVNMHQFIPTPSSKPSGFRNEIESTFSSCDASKCSKPYPTMLSNVSRSNQALPRTSHRRKKMVPMISSLIRSNHQNAAEHPHSSYLKTNKAMPTFGGTDGELGNQDQLGQTYTPNDRHLLNPADQGVGVAVENELSHPSNTVRRESLKRNFDLPPVASTPVQRRKFISQTSVPQFSPYLLQNALGQNAVDKSMPAFTSSTNPSLIPSAVATGPSASSSTKNLPAFPAAARTSWASTTSSISLNYPASEAAFVSPTHIPAACGTSRMCFPAEGPAVMSPPSIYAAPLALERAVAARTCLPRIPVAASKRVMPATFSPSSHIPAPDTTPSKTPWSSNTSKMTYPALRASRKSAPALAALAKASPAFTASASMPHIKWRGFDGPQATGLKCMLCKRDLSYTPEGPVFQPPIPPAVAVLPCGHTFHDHCLLLITPKDQSKDPPCIPCAIGEI